MKTIDMFYNFDADALWEGITQNLLSMKNQILLSLLLLSSEQKKILMFLKRRYKNIYLIILAHLEENKVQDKKQAWFPLRELMKGYRVVSSNPLPLKYAQCISVSKGMT